MTNENEPITRKEFSDLDAYAHKAETKLAEQQTAIKDDVLVLREEVEALKPKPYDKRERHRTCNVNACTEVGVGEIDGRIDNWLLTRTHLCKAHLDEYRAGKKLVLDMNRLEGHAVQAGTSNEDRLLEAMNQAIEKNTKINEEQRLHIKRLEDEIKELRTVIERADANTQLLIQGNRELLGRN